MRPTRLLLLFLSFIASVDVPAFTAERPNIVLIMADDQGWGDTGYNGHPELKTPNLLDGLSLLPVFDRQTESRAKAIPFWSHSSKQPGHAALLDWPYKLHTNPVAGRDKKGTKSRETLPVVQLYDVSKDPKEEATDLAAQEPERVAKMTAALETWKASVEKSLSGADYAATPEK